MFSDAEDWVDDALAAPEYEFVDVRVALEELARLAECHLGEVVKMRSFGNMNDAEIAQALRPTDRTVRRGREEARQLLVHALRHGRAGPTACGARTMIRLHELAPPGSRCSSCTISIRRRKRSTETSAPEHRLERRDVQTNLTSLSFSAQKGKWSDSLAIGQVNHPEAALCERPELADIDAHGANCSA
jgi:hypothetical protein